jgi:MFS family permease
MEQQKPASTARVLSASVIGMSIEFYDFYIYGIAASLILGQLFFPGTSPAVQIMLSYATFSVAFLARPLGALVFGHFGDRISRKAIFVSSLIVMGCSTVAIGLLPTYAQIGWIAPLILCVMRFGQGFGLGGVWSGATLLATENAPASHGARFGMVPQLGYPLGFIAANGMFFVLGHFLSLQEFQQWGWRVPFLASFVLIGLALWARFKLAEPRDFLMAVKNERLPRVPIIELLRSSPRETLAATFAVVGPTTSYYLSSVFALGYATTALGYGRQEFLGLLLTSIPFFGVGVLVTGSLADRVSTSRILVIACGSLVVAGFLLQPLMASGVALEMWAYLAIAFFCTGLTIGPYGIWMARQFHTQVRYTGTALAYNVGNIIGAGFTPIIAQSLTHAGGLRYVGYYLSSMALLSLLAFASGRQVFAPRAAPTAV